MTARERGRHGSQRGDLFPLAGNETVPAELSVDARRVSIAGDVRPVGRKGRQRAKRIGHPGGVFRSLGFLVSWRA